MTKDSGRKCSSCGINGHNSRTCKCNEKMGVKLFGVTIMKGEESMKKSLSMGNIHAHNQLEHDRGYLSDGPKRDSHERKRGVPWTKEEHETFLKGLERLGKGDWRGISRKFVTTKTPTQVASHAQKYFLRQKTANSSSIKKKRRTSLFDLHHKGNHHTALSNLNPTMQLTEQMAALATTATPRPSMENSLWPKPAASRASVEASLWPKPAPTYPIIPHANIPHLVGGSTNYAGLSMVPTAIHFENNDYFYASQSINKLAVGGQMLDPQPRVAASESFFLSPLPTNFKVQSEQLGVLNPSSVNTDLKLSIGGGHSPMPKDRNKFSSETSNLISVI
ncbi:hypothetical protein MKW94_001707 [Papaver nudicaule]|uniref:MYB transcription factor n=1 Tax=Papaver nudicaule TaxID=74823 RepID=A0AA41UVX1_PAPNU|nr:hypothetical protein [Papaver nudicaule]